MHKPFRNAFSKTAFLIMALVLFMPFSSSVESGIMIDSRSAKPGDTVGFVVMISPGPTDLRAFGFEIRFNSAVLEYVNYSPGTVRDRFDFFEISNPSEGVLRAAGISVSPVTIDATADLLHLEFRCRSCEEKESLLVISRKMDDFKEWDVQPGIFACIAEETEEKEPPPEEAEDVLQTDENRERKVIELTNKGNAQDQRDTSFTDGPHGTLPFGFPPQREQAIEASSGGGGGGGAGASQESFDTSGLSAPYGVIPTVESTSPDNGAKGIDTDASIRIVFNQSMDLNGVEQAFRITPPVQGHFTWKDALSDCMFAPYEPLAPGTCYTVCLTDQAADIYGRLLDGDLDGVAGGECCFTFHTAEAAAIDGEPKPLPVAPRVSRCFIACTGEHAP
ncbi:MAG: Ig-like domain-containing protein [bacterium]